MILLGMKGLNRVVSFVISREFVTCQSPRFVRLSPVPHVNATPNSIDGKRLIAILKNYSCKFSVSNELKPWNFTFFFPGKFCSAHANMLKIIELSTATAYIRHTGKDSRLGRNARLGWCASVL